MGKLDRLEEVEGRVQEGDAQTPTVAVEWRDAAPEARPDGLEWDAAENRLTFDFWAAQREALDALDDPDTDLVGFVAGYRSGKSILGARWVLTQALEHPGTRHLVMGQDFTKAQGATYRVLHSQLPPTDVRTDLVTSGFNGPEESPIVEDYNRTRHTIALRNGSVIVLGAGDRWSRHAGDEFASIWADEVAHFEENVHDILEMLGSRLTSDTGPNKIVMTTTGAGYNDAYEILEKQVDEDGDPLGLNIELIRASVLDNPYLDVATRDRLERQYAGTGREEQALHGGFSAATGLVYSNFDRGTHVIPHAEAVDLVDDSRQRVFAYDAGWRDPRVVLEAGPSPYGQFIVLREFYEREAPLDEAMRWIRERDNIGTDEGRQRPRGVVWCEHEPADVEKMKRHAIDARNAEKSIDSGISAVRARFDADEGDRPGILISDECTNLIHELQSYQRSAVGTSGATDHAVDCLRYIIASEERHGRGLSTGVYPHDFIVGEREYL